MEDSSCGKKCKQGLASVNSGNEYNLDTSNERLVNLGTHYYNY